MRTWHATHVSSPRSRRPPLPNVITCASCGQERQHWGKNLCRPCFNHGYRVIHKERVQEQTRVWRIANAERERQTAKHYEKTHVKRYIKWHIANTDKVRESSKRRYQANKERINAGIRRWRLAHKGQVLAMLRNGKQRRRAFKRALPATLTVTQWTAVLVAYDHRCAYCGVNGLKLTQDHVIPLSKGGAYEMGNIVPACRPCNSRKGAGAPPKDVRLLLL